MPTRYLENVCDVPHYVSVLGRLREWISSGGKHSSEAETEQWKTNISCITIQTQDGKLHERVIMAAFRPTARRQRNRPKPIGGANRAGQFLAPGSPVGGYFKEDRQATACACFKENKPAMPIGHGSLHLVEPSREHREHREHRVGGSAGRRVGGSAGRRWGVGALGRWGVGALGHAPTPIRRHVEFACPQIVDP